MDRTSRSREDFLVFFGYFLVIPSAVWGYSFGYSFGRRRASVLLY